MGRLFDLGAREVCFTFGAGGCAAFTPEEAVRLPAHAVEIVDATGAGDAFWAGYLAARLDGLPLEGRVAAGIAVAAYKIRQVGPLREAVDYRGLVGAVRGAGGEALDRSERN